MTTTQAMMALAIAVAIIISCGPVGAEIVVFDRVTLADQPVQLVILTKGKIFPEGGQLVTLFIGQTRLKNVLTGGDGYGYLDYRPARVGYKKISAEYKNGSGTGKLLVMGPKQKAVLVDIDTATRDSMLSIRLRQGTRAALEAISKKYRIIYLHGMTGFGLARQWLETTDLPPSVVLSAHGAGRTKILKRNRIQLHALVGSAEQMTAAGDDIQKLFTFEETRKGRQVESWEEVLEALEIKTSPDSE